MPLSDAGKLIWRSGRASSYIFSKDYSRIFELSIDPKEDSGRASSGSLRHYRGTGVKRHIELEFTEIGATQYNQFSSIWKRATALKFRRRQDQAILGTFWWVEGFNFAYSDEGMRYKDLWDGRIIIEEA